MKGFGSDNHSGVHPQILKAIVSANVEHAPSYGTDEWSDRAKASFKKHFGNTCEVSFVFNGTAANVLSMKAMTQSFHSVLCSEVSHLNADECAAPEVLAQVKLIPLPHNNGKISLVDIKNQFIRRGDQHFTQAKVISLTQPTEYGTCYTQNEIKEICDYAHANQMFVHIDGARLSNACVSLNKTYEELTTDCGVDVVSFGGTKNGFLFGEAILFLNPKAFENFQYFRKQFCQLPSKSRFLAAQFSEYLENDLWKQIATHSLKMAKLLFQELKQYPELRVNQEPQSNAIFPFIPKPWLKKLKEHSFFYVWDEHAQDNALQCRLMCSWDTQESEIKSFSQKIRELQKNEIPTHSLS